jgi:hypothetical protein
MRDAICGDGLTGARGRRRPNCTQSRRRGSFPAARNRKARTTVLVLAEKTLANGNRTPPNFARGETRDVIFGGSGGRNRHASVSCGAASADGSRRAASADRNRGAEVDADFGTRRARKHSRQRQLRGGERRRQPRSGGPRQQAGAKFGMQRRQRR